MRSLLRNRKFFRSLATTPWHIHKTHTHTAATFPKWPFGLHNTEVIAGVGHFNDTYFETIFLSSEDVGDPVPGVALNGTMVSSHPLFDDYWRGKHDAMENIRVPMYILGSFVNPFMFKVRSIRSASETRRANGCEYTLPLNSMRCMILKLWMTRKDFMTAIAKGFRTDGSTIQLRYAYHYMGLEQFQTLWNEQR